MYVLKHSLTGHFVANSEIRYTENINKAKKFRTKESADLCRNANEWTVPLTPTMGRNERKK